MPGSTANAQVFLNDYAASKIVSFIKQLFAMNQAGVT